MARLLRHGHLHESADRDPGRLTAIESWSSFFVAEVGAAAALSGLLVVAISVNIHEILQSPKLPARVGATICMLVTALIVASLVLLPGQSRRVLGVELVIVGGLAALIPFGLMWRHRGADDGEPPGVLLGRSALTVLGTVIAPTAGIVLIADQSWGLYVLAAAVLAAFVVAMVNTWVFLVEIRR